MAKRSSRKKTAEKDRIASKVPKLERITERIKKSSANLRKEQDAFLRELMAITAEAHRAGHRVELVEEQNGEVVSSIDLSENPAGLLSLFVRAEDRGPGPQQAVYVPDPAFCWAVGCAPIYTKPGKICMVIGCYIGVGVLKCVTVCITETPM